MTMQDWLNSREADAKSRRPYAHFDSRKGIRDLRTFLPDPERVARHGFYPFIHYTQTQEKYSRDGGKKVKTRDICYASHTDRCIYQYYSMLLGEAYNRRAEADGIGRTAVAYRTNLRQSNIDFAKRAFDFVRESAPCCIMIGDFTGFFDNLDHRYLKRQWCSLLGVSQLPEDQYKVFRSVTRYSTWELTDLLALNHLKNNREGLRELNGRKQVLTPAEYRAYSNREHIHVNPHPYGIPQGSPISGLLANIYMLETDKAVHDLVTERKGLYMRYSDDFIVVLPDAGASAEQTLREISDRFNAVEGLTLEPKKTQYFHFGNQRLENCGGRFGVPPESEKRFVSFLGFTFDGEKVSIRSKTVGKYYYRMYKKAKTITRCGGISPRKHRISKRNLYALYSVKGARGYTIKAAGGRVKRGTGNFLSYVQRAERKFGKNELVSRDTRRHMQKIHKALRGI